MTTYWGFRDSIKFSISSKLVIFGHNLGTVIRVFNSDTIVFNKILKHKT